jgi:hydroxymethylglutaryl-CoA reductase
MLKNPSAKELMKGCGCRFSTKLYVAFVDYNRYSDGHMKMHLNNILNQFEANEDERNPTRKHFKHHAVSHSAVVDYIDNLRK